MSMGIWDPLSDMEETSQTRHTSLIWIPTTRTTKELDAKLCINRVDNIGVHSHPQLGTNRAAPGQRKLSEARALVEENLDVGHYKPIISDAYAASDPPSRPVAAPKHQAVLAEESVELLSPERGGYYVDATLGMGGHSLQILTRSNQAKVVGIDRDEAALDMATARLSGFSNRFQGLHGNYQDLGLLLAAAGVHEPVRGILLDLGVSSEQIDNPSRGFSFQFDGPLDMRMDQTQATTAAALVNTLSKEKLAEILRKYGEEPRAKRIASAIVRHRASKSIESTHELVALVRKAYGASAFKSRKNPATKTFQALRIAVNKELDGLRTVLPHAFESLALQGRLVVITFHSLEDRMVKQFMREMCTGCICPPDFPICQCLRTARAKMLTRKPISPTEEEKQENPRARSAKLRAIEKVTDSESEIKR